MNSKDKMIYCYIISTKRNFLRRLAVNITWGLRIGKTFYSDHSAPNVIKVSNSNRYESGVEKQMAILKLLQSTFKDLSKQEALASQRNEWLLFVDDDTYVNVKNLMRVVEGLDVNVVYSELHDYRVQEENGNSRIFATRLAYPNLIYGLHGGAGILVTKNTISHLSFEDLNLSGVENGDVAFSILCHTNGVRMCNLRGLNWNNWRFYPKEILEEPWITFHYNRFRDMLRLRYREFRGRNS